MTLTQFAALLPHEIEEDNARQGISQGGSDGDLSMESGGSDSEDGKLSDLASITFLLTCQFR